MIPGRRISDIIEIEMLVLAQRRLAIDFNFER